MSLAEHGVPGTPGQPGSQAEDGDDMDLDDEDSREDSGAIMRRKKKRRRKRKSGEGLVRTLIFVQASTEAREAEGRDGLQCTDYVTSSLLLWT